MTTGINTAGSHDRSGPQAYSAHLTIAPTNAGAAQTRSNLCKTIILAEGHTVWKLSAIRHYDRNLRDKQHDDKGVEGHTKESYNRNIYKSTKGSSNIGEQICTEM